MKRISVLCIYTIYINKYLHPERPSGTNPVFLRLLGKYHNWYKIGDHGAATNINIFITKSRIKSLMS